MAEKKRKLVTNPAASPQKMAEKAHPAIVKKELREIFRNAFDELGGASWLVAFARRDDQNARTFVQAIARLMPMEFAGKDGAPLTITIMTAGGVPQTVNLDGHPEPAVIEDGRVLN